MWPPIEIPVTPKGPNSPNSFDDLRYSNKERVSQTRAMPVDIMSVT